MRFLDNQADTTRRLRALWALNAIGGVDEAALIGLLDDRDESIRGWAVRLLVGSVSSLGRRHEPARGHGASEASPRVRLGLASALQRIPIKDRWPLAERWPRPRSIRKTRCCRS